MSLRNWTIHLTAHSLCSSSYFRQALCKKQRLVRWCQHKVSWRLHTFVPRRQPTSTVSLPHIQLHPTVIQRHGSQLDTKAVVAFLHPSCVVLRFHDPTLPHLAGRLSSGSNARVLTEHTTCHNLPSCINLAPTSLRLVQPLWRIDRQLIQIMSRRVLSCLLSVSHRTRHACPKIASRVGRCHNLSQFEAATTMRTSD